MQYKREFKLKPYWKNLLISLYETRQLHNNDLERGRTTNLYHWDDQDWILGAYTLVIKPEQLHLIINGDLDEIYHYSNLTLKIFYDTPYPLFMDMRDVDWGMGRKLVKASFIQNLLHFGNLAPRVIDLAFLVNGDRKYAAQVTEYISLGTAYDPNIDPERLTEITTYCGKNHIIPYDIDNRNTRNGLFVDFENFVLDPFFKQDFIEKIRAGLSFGGDSHIPYQSVTEINLKGRRNNILRSQIIKINSDELPENFSALDVGCNGAFFLRRAVDAGCTNPVGVDLPEVISASKPLNHYLGYFMMDFYPEIPNEGFDLIFFLSMMSYLPDKLEEVCQKTRSVLWFEGHGGHHETEYIPLLEPHFREIRIAGYTDDYPESGKRVIIKCEK